MCLCVGLWQDESRAVKESKTPKGMLATCYSYLTSRQRSPVMASSDSSVHYAGLPCSADKAAIPHVLFEIVQLLPRKTAFMSL